MRSFHSCEPTVFIIPSFVYNLQLLHLYLSYTPADIVCARMWLCYGNGILTFNEILDNSTRLIDKLSLDGPDRAQLKV